MAPKVNEDECGGGEGDEKTPPEASGAEFSVEAEKDAEGHADDPVADELGVEGGGGVAGSAEGSGGGDLDAVKELKAGGDEEQGDCGGDDAGVGGEEVGDAGGDGEEEDGGAEHEGGTDGDTAPAGGSCVGECGGAGADATDGVADADGGGGGDGEGHHEGGGGALQGDLVAGEGELAEGGDERGDKGEDGDFDEDGGADGEAEEEELAEVLELEPPWQPSAVAGGPGNTARDAAEAVGVFAVEVPEGEGEDQHEVEAGEAGGPGGADDSVGGDVEWVAGDVEGVAVDEEPVGCGVDDVGGDEGEGDGAAVVGGLEVSAEDEVEQQGEGAVVEAAHGGNCAGEDGGVYGEVQKEDGSDEEDGDEEGGEGEAGEESVEKPAVGGVLIFGTEGLGDEGVESEEDAADADGDGVEDDLREGGGGHGEGRVREVAEHDGVDQGHGDPAELAGDERQRKMQQRREFAANV